MKKKLFWLSVSVFIALALPVFSGREFERFLETYIFNQRYSGTLLWSTVVPLFTVTLLLVESAMKIAPNRRIEVLLGGFYFYILFFYLVSQNNNLPSDYSHSQDLPYAYSALAICIVFPAILKVLIKKKA